VRNLKTKMQLGSLTSYSLASLSLRSACNAKRIAPRQPRPDETPRRTGPDEHEAALTLETLARPGWRTSSTNCFRESRRLVMNLRVRSVTAGAAFVSAMLDAACLRRAGSASPELARAGAWRRRRRRRGRGRGSKIYLLKP
jgi:hypothetical protein